MKKKLFAIGLAACMSIICCMSVLADNYKEDSVALDNGTWGWGSLGIYYYNYSAEAQSGSNAISTTVTGYTTGSTSVRGSGTYRAEIDTSTVGTITLAVSNHQFGMRSMTINLYP